jgi:hypothetical protein
MFSGGRINAHDPQFAKIALFAFPVSICIAQCVFYSLAGGTKKFASSSAISLGHFQIFFVPLMRSLTSLNAHD